MGEPSLSCSNICLAPWKSILSLEFSLISPTGISGILLLCSGHIGLFCCVWSPGCLCCVCSPGCLCVETIPTPLLSVSCRTSGSLCCILDCWLLIIRRWWREEEREVGPEERQGWKTGCIDLWGPLAAGSSCKVGLLNGELDVCLATWKYASSNTSSSE